MIDGGRRDGSRQLLGRRDAVHVRHVDVHQDDVRGERRRELQGLRAGRRRTDDVDVALEAEQLREVVARLRDVVDDQDADLVSHLRVWLFVLIVLVVTLDGRGTCRSIAPVAPGSGCRLRPG